MHFSPGFLLRMPSRHAFTDPSQFFRKGSPFFLQALELVPPQGRPSGRKPRAVGHVLAETLLPRQTIALDSVGVAATLVPDSRARTLFAARFPRALGTYIAGSPRQSRRLCPEGKYAVPRQPSRMRSWLRRMWPERTKRG
jgi:hypothetical protein